MGERHERIKSIFLSAARLDENERAELLGRECGDNAETSRHLLSLAHGALPNAGLFFHGCAPRNSQLGRDNRKAILV